MSIKNYDYQSNADDALQRLFDFGILKLKSGVKQALRDDPLTFEQNRAEFTQEKFYHEAGRGQK